MAMKTVAEMMLDCKQTKETVAVKEREVMMHCSQLEMFSCESSSLHFLFFLLLPS